MKACVKIPDYGANLRAWAKGKGLIRIARKATPRPWVAFETSTGLEFLKGITDYSNCNCEGTKGIVVRFFCEIGKVYIFCIPHIRGGRKIIKAKVGTDGSLQEKYRG